MRILVAGATGTLGRPLVRALVAHGHQVVGLTRSAARRPLIESAGARALVADALQADALAAVVREASPTLVVHLLTAIPAEGPRRPADLRATNRVRTEGTRNLLHAAIAAGARRIVAESFMAVYGPAAFDRPHGEDAPLADIGRSPLRETVLALRDLEQQLRQARLNGSIETVALRFGGFYGPGVPSTETLVRQVRAGRLFSAPFTGLLSSIHLHDAVTATVAAVEHESPGEVYNIVDDVPMSLEELLRVASEVLGGRPPRRAPAWLVRITAPVVAELGSWRLSLSNARARQELRWMPRYGSVRDGLRGLADRVTEAA